MIEYFRMDRFSSKCLLKLFPDLQQRNYQSSTDYITGGWCNCYVVEVSLAHRVIQETRHHRLHNQWDTAASSVSNALSLSLSLSLHIAVDLTDSSPEHAAAVHVRAFDCFRDNRLPARRDGDMGIRTKRRPVHAGKSSAPRGPLTRRPSSGIASTDDRSPSNGRTK